MIALLGAVATDVGNVREVNQDRGFISPNTYVVADGMGGHRGGEVAAMLAISKFEHAPELLKPGTLEHLAKQGNDLVHERSQEGDLQGMGTTLVAVALDTSNSVTLINVGDSRGYWLRDGCLAQVTEDHSFVGELLKRGELSEEEAQTHPKRNIITRALGISEELEVDKFPLNIEIGDRLLLCSDGLTDELEPLEIAEVLAWVEDRQEAARTLVSKALEGEGKDNVTAVVVDVVDADSVGELAVVDDQVVATPSNDDRPPSIDRDSSELIDDSSEHEAS